MKKPFSEVALQTRESLERPYFPLPLDPRRLKNTTTSSLFHCKLHFSPYLAGADHLRAVEIEMDITQDLLKAVDKHNFMDRQQDLHSFMDRQREQDQGSSESVEIQVFFGYLSMLGVLSVKYQGISISLLEEHKGIIYIFVIVISIYVATIIVGKKLGPIRLLSATIAPILLFFILVPELGWPALDLWVILVAKLAWEYDL